MFVSAKLNNNSTLSNFYSIFCKIFDNRLNIQTIVQIMKGSVIKEVLRANGRQMKQIAEKMGTSLSNLSAGLSKDDVRTGLLEEIAAAAGLHVSAFYGEAFGPVQTATGSNNTQVAGNSNTVTTSDQAVLELLKVKDEQLTMAMRQTSKAQEQMDRVLDRICGPQCPHNAEV